MQHISRISYYYFYYSCIYISELHLALLVLSLRQFKYNEECRLFATEHGTHEYLQAQQHILHKSACKGPFKCYVMQVGGGVSSFQGKKHYEGVWFNVISITSRGWVQFPEKTLRNT